MPFFVGKLLIPNLDQSTNLMKIVECPRDAMQGLSYMIPTEQKILYLNALMRIGFDTLDLGSFVSPKAIPQMQDTPEVLQGLDLSLKKSKFLVIVASRSGAEKAVKHSMVDCLGFPLSVSETFQMRNTNKNIDEALTCLAEIKEITKQHKKELAVYLSMGFGNPYGDPYDIDLIEAFFMEKMHKMGIKTVLLSDTIGVSQPEQIIKLFSRLIPLFPDIEIGAHFHSNPRSATAKIQAAYESGCRRFDGAIGGFGGCPLATEELTGNIATEQMIGFFMDRKIETGINLSYFSEAVKLCQKVFHPTQA